MLLQRVGVDSRWLYRLSVRHMVNTSGAKCGEGMSSRAEFETAMAEYLTNNLNENGRSWYFLCFSIIDQ